MKTKLTIILLLISTLSFAQARLGYTKEQIIKSHKYATSKIVSQKCLETRFSDGAFVFHYFNESNLSYAALYVFASSKDRTFVITNLNTNMVVVSKTHWLDYLDDGNIIDIQLFYDEKAKLDYLYYTIAK